MTFVQRHAYGFGCGLAALLYISHTLGGLILTGGGDRLSLITGFCEDLIRLGLSLGDDLIADSLSILLDLTDDYIYTRHTDHIAAMPKTARMEISRARMA